MANNRFSNGIGYLPSFLQMLSLNNVFVGYGGADVVKNISLDVKSNENLSIIGPNGCGKTTLLKAVANILSFKGEITVDGKNIRKMNSKEISLKIAMFSQISGIYFTYTVFDTVMMGRYAHIKDRFLGIPSENDKKYVMHCLNAVNLTKEKDIEITKLSGGQLQRVFLARTLAQEPNIILLDEPTNHLDLKYQIELIEYLKKWSSEGNRAVIGVMHDINLAIRLSDKLMVMKDGEIQAHGTIGNIITNSLLKKVYGIDVAGYMIESLRAWENFLK